MWSSNRTDDMTLRNWVPNNFCPILLINHEVPDVIAQFDDIMGDLSMNSDQVENSIYSLCSDTDESIGDPFLMNPLVSIDVCENQIETVVASPNSECSPSESHDKTSAKELVGTQLESVEVESTCMSLGTAEMDSKHNSTCSTSDEEEKFAEQSLSLITAQMNRKPNTVCSTSDEDNESIQKKILLLFQL